MAIPRGRAGTHNEIRKMKRTFPENFVSEAQEKKDFFLSYDSEIIENARELSSNVHKSQYLERKVRTVGEILYLINAWFLLK